MLLKQCTLNMCLRYLKKKNAACCTFLEDYLVNDGYVFSSNYDLLLYWVLMRNTCKNAGDGFGREVENPLGDEYVPDYEPEYSELRWGKNKDSPIRILFAWCASSI